MKADAKQENKSHQHENRLNGFLNTAQLSNFDRKKVNWNSKKTNDDAETNEKKNVAINCRRKLIEKLNARVRFPRTVVVAAASCAAASNFVGILFPFGGLFILIAVQ